MAILREIRRRISGVKNTQKITKAMKMVAAAKLRRAQDAVIAARPYARRMKELLQHLAGRVDISANPLFTIRSINKVAIVVITADRGLCGAFNGNLIKAAAAYIYSKYREIQEAGGVKVICVGKKGYDFFQKNKYNIRSRYLGVFLEVQFSHAQAIVAELIQGFLEGEYDRVDIVYNEFKSIIKQRVVIEQFLPIPPEEVTFQAKSQKMKSQIDYIYEPSSESIISALVPKHLNFQLWHMLLESNAAEQGARMAAMDNATTNASEMIRELQLSYNKARQSAITKELLEIVSGAEALKKVG